MRVLLLHEMSGLHTELRRGLRAVGVQADIATFGDHHKRFATDINIGSTDAGASNTAGRVLRQLRNAPRYRTYDVIQSISPQPFNRALTRLIEPYVLGRKPPAFVYLAAGSDALYRRYVRDLDYWPPHDWHENDAIEKQERRVLKRADAIVSAIWDYQYTLRQAGFSSELIPFPVDISRYDFSPAGTRDRILVYHPINRPEGNDGKGISFIRAAFDKVRDELSDVADFVERGGMSFSEYMEFTSTVDILVDQATAYTYGMSTTYALARGQVVLSGNHPATHEDPDFARSPVVPITPDADQIADTLRALIRDRARLREMSYKGRAYAEDVHDAIKVARRYKAVYERISRLD